MSRCVIAAVCRCCTAVEYQMSDADPAATELWLRRPESFAEARRSLESESFRAASYEEFEWALSGQQVDKIFLLRRARWEAADPVRAGEVLEFRPLFGAK